MAPKYRDYRLNSMVIHKETKATYIITDRNHKERTVYLLPQMGRQSLSRPPTFLAHWKTLKELNRHFTLVDKRIAKVLYGV